MIDLGKISRAIDAHDPEIMRPPPATRERAAVALVLAGADDNLSMCFIKRAPHPDDPWSGHMALPGGRFEQNDGDSRAVAVRETFEEVGVALAPEHDIGPLSEMPIARKPHPLAGVLSPHVFYLAGPAPDFNIDPREVAEAFWIPLSHICNPSNLSTRTWHKRPYPGIEFRGEMVWGLTLRVLYSFTQLVGLPLVVDELSILGEDD